MKRGKRFLAGFLTVLMLILTVSAAMPPVYGEEEGPIRVTKAVVQGEKSLYIFFSTPSVRNKTVDVGLVIVDGDGNIVKSATEGNDLALPGYIGNVVYPYSPISFTLNSTASVTVDGETVTDIPGFLALVSDSGAYKGNTVMFRMKEKDKEADSFYSVKGNGFVDSLFAGDSSELHFDRPVIADHVAADGYDELYFPVTEPGVLIDSVYCYNDKEFVLNFSEPVELTEKYAAYVRIVNAATNELKSADYQYNVTRSVGNATWSSLAQYGNVGAVGVTDKWFGVFQNAKHSLSAIYQTAAELSESEGVEYAVRFCIEEKNAGGGGPAYTASGDGFVQVVKSVATGEYLRSDYRVSGKFDGAYAPITVPHDLSAEATAIDSEHISITFSEPVDLNAYSNYAGTNTWVGVRIYDPAAGNYVTVDNVTYQWRFPLTATEDPYTFTATRLSSASINGIRKLEDIKALVEEGGQFEGLGYEVRFCFQHTTVSATGSYRVGGYVNNFRGNAGGMLPDNDNTATLAHYIPLKFITVGSPELLKVEAIDEMHIVATFSEPVDIKLSTWAGLRLVDENDALVYDGSDPMQWYGVGDGTVGRFTWYDEEHTKILWTLKPNNTRCESNLNDIISMANLADGLKKYQVKFGFEEAASGGVSPTQNNGTVDTVTSVETGVALPATFNAEKKMNAAYKTVTFAYDATPVTLKSAEVIDGSSVVLTFSEPVEIKGNIWAGLRVVDQNNKLMYYNDGESPLQWYGVSDEDGYPFTWYNTEHTKMLWTFRGSNTMGLKNVYEVLTHTGQLGEIWQNEWSVKFCIEEKAKDSDSFTGGNGLIDTLKAVSRERHVSSNIFRSGGAPDDIFLSVSGTIVEQELEATGAVILDDSRIVVSFSAPMTLLSQPAGALMLVNENNEQQYRDNGDGTSTAIRFGGSFSYYDAAHSLLCWTIDPDQPDFGGMNNIADILAFKDMPVEWQDYEFKFCIEESDAAVMANNYIDDIALAANHTVHCDANQPAQEGKDRSFFSVVYTGGAPQLIKAEAIDEMHIVATFSQPVDIKLSTWIGLRLVDENDALVYDGNTSNPMQWYGNGDGTVGRFTWYNDAHTQILWTLKANNTRCESNINDIVNMANLKNELKQYKIKFGFEEANFDGKAPDKTNGSVDTVVSVESGFALPATCTVSGNMNAAYIPVTFAYDPAPVTVKKVEILDDTNLIVTFSEPVEIKGNIWAGLRVVDENNTLMYYNDGESPMQWYGRPDANGYPFKWYNKTHTKMIWTFRAVNTMSLNSVYEVLNKEGKLGELWQEGWSVKFCIEEKKKDEIGFTGGNGLIDTLKAVNRDRHVSSNIFRSGAAPDDIFLPVKGEIVTDKLEATGASVLDDTHILLSFSSPIELVGAPYGAIRLVNDNNALQYRENEDGTRTAIQWGGAFSYYGDDHTKIVWQIYGNQRSFGDLNNIPDILAFKGLPEEWKQYTFKFCLEEKKAAVAANNHIDDIVKADDARIHCLANKPNMSGYDGSYFTITNELPDDELSVSARIVNERQILLSFTAPVVIEGDPWFGIRLVKNGKLAWNREENTSTPLQWKGTMDWANSAHTQILWTMNGGSTYGAYNIYDIVNFSGGLKAFNEGHQICFCIEEKKTDDWQKNISYNQRIDNIRSADGTRHLVGSYCTGYDGIFIPLNAGVLQTEKLTLLSALAINDQQVEVVFSEPVVIDEAAVTLALRYLTPSGDTDVGTDGRTSVFKGTWEYKNDIHDTLIWTLDPSNNRGAANLTQLFRYEGNFANSDGCTVSMYIVSDEEHTPNVNTMRVDGVKDVSGVKNLAANRLDKVCAAYCEVTLGYELPQEDTPVVDPIVNIIEVSDYLAAYIAVGVLIFLGVIIGIAVGKKKER